MKTWQMALIGLLVAGGVGLAVFLMLARQAVKVERADRTTAHRELDEARSAFGKAMPLVTLDADNKPHRQARLPQRGQQQPASQLMALAYRAPDEALVRAKVPLWFLRMKEPAVRFALGGTGLDPVELGLTADELEQLGRALVLDVTKANGDRLLVWTE
jgi:hypothetical protein